jgi:hypothetical protein
MADKNGNKTGGKVKGQPNKRTVYSMIKAQGTLDLYKCDPLAFLCHVVNANAVALKETEITLDHRISAAKELASYTHSKLKAVEHTFNPSGLDDEELLQETARVLIELKGKK